MMNKVDDDHVPDIYATHGKNSEGFEVIMILNERDFQSNKTDVAGDFADHLTKACSFCCFISSK